MTATDDLIELERNRLQNYLTYLNLQEQMERDDFEVRLKRIDEKRKVTMEELVNLNTVFLVGGEAPKGFQ